MRLLLVVLLLHSARVNADEAKTTHSSHPAGPKYLAKLEKLDNPKLAENFKSQDADDRWPYYDDMVDGPWAEFKKQFGIDPAASGAIDAESFESDWFEQLKKDVGSTLTGPDYNCPLAFNASTPSTDVKRVLAQSKQCMEALKAIKSYRCVDRPKQSGHVKLELQKDGTLVMNIHDPHQPDSSMNFGDVLEQYAKTFPKCQKVVASALH